MNERRYDIDWLRVIAMMGVFVFHCTRFFDPEPWNLKAPAAQISEVVPIVRQLFLWQWLMELFFFMAGFATWYALRRRSPGQYLAERARRLLVPMYTIGLFVLLVPQVYFNRVTHNGVTATFWQWLPGYIRGLPGEILAAIRAFNLRNPLSLLPINDTGHLWFIAMLFLIALIMLPVILWLRSQPGQRLMGALAARSMKPGGIFLLAIPLALGRIALNWMPVTTDWTWADFVWYALFFVTGFIFASDERFTESARQHGWLCLGLWLGLVSAGGVVFSVVMKIDVNAWNGFSLPYVIWQTIYSIASWSAVVFLLSMGAKYLNFTNPFLAYSSEAVMPFYIFHQTIILIAGWFVMPLAISGIAKFLIVAVVSFPVILILYELFVRRINLMRFLFGMPPARKKAVPAPRKVVPTT